MTVTDYCRWKMSRRRIGLADVAAAYHRGARQPSHSGRVRCTLEIAGRLLVVVAEGDVVVTAYRPRRQPRRR